MRLIQEYPNHDGMIKLLFAAFFYAAYFALDKLGTSAYSWQTISDPNVWANSFLTTAMLYCTFDAFSDIALKRHKDAKPFVAILSFVASTVLSSVRVFTLSSEVSVLKKGGVYLVFAVDFIGFLLLELFGYNFSYLNHSGEIEQAQKDYLREFNILPDEDLDAFIGEYSRLVSHPEVFGQLMPGAPYERYVQMLKDALREKERRKAVWESNH
jgi:hypothetical protein